MKVSLNWIRRYIDIPADLTDEQIAYDLTMRTVEVEDVVNTAEKYHDIVVGRITEIQAHPNADLLKICIVDIGEAEPVQIVCGGSNLYEGENVVVSKPGSFVVWHGEGEPVKIKETKMRGVPSYGMICAASEVYLDPFFHDDDERVIVDLGDTPCTPGQNVAEVVGMDDTVLEIDNKSLTNRPDLWGHYGIAREIAAIYDLKLKTLPHISIDRDLPGFPVDIKEPQKCNRYDALVIDNVYDKESPLWIKSLLINAGMRPINAIVDITNYVMLAVGQPTHGFDRTHVVDKIIVRNAAKGEKLELLDGNKLDLTESDLVICDAEEPMALAGIRGGRKDSILPETTSIVLEVADFTAETIRKTGSRFDEKTDSSIRYEKGIDTERVDLGISVALSLFNEVFPEIQLVAYGSQYPVHTEKQIIEVTQDFLDRRLGTVLEKDEIKKILTRLGYDIEFTDNGYMVTAPVWRSTGDVSIKDDVLGDLARLIGYENFEAKPFPVNFEHAVRQPKQNLDRRLREYLAFRCGFNEVFTYPWIDEKFIEAANIDVSKAIDLATPPAPELRHLRQSLIPGLLEASMKNLRYFDEFNIFEMAQVFEKGEMHPSSDEETLPMQSMHLAGMLVGNDPKMLFFKAKGVIESMAGYCHMEEITLKQETQPGWADNGTYLNVIMDGEVIGDIGIVSVPTMNNAGIRRTSIAAFELDETKLVPLASRNNEFKHLPQFPLVEEDLSLLVDEDVTWESIREAIKFMVKDLQFVEEYRGKQIPDGKKSVMLRLKIGSDEGTMNAKQIDRKMKGIISALQKKCKAELRDE
ncbi:MAG: phenylalanine--tRNA ligase subunit beta [Clostridiales bacterium]|nr:phenylalanine--tRNA ligase subunit beta [Clostridiales bacterium]